MEDEELRGVLCFSTFSLCEGWDIGPRELDDINASLSGFFLKVVQDFNW